MADQPTPPLNANSPIVDPASGKPKPPFILLINQLLKSTVASASTIAQQALDAAKAATTAVTALGKKVVSLTARVEDLEDTQVLGGIGIDGGGMIGDGDITLDLADTAIAPGTYGDATHSAQITIDQQGRVTAASDVPISGGGGGGGYASGRYFRIRGLRGGNGPSVTDGLGFALVNFRDSGGVALIPTPGTGGFANNTDGGFSIAAAFDGSSASSHGWYSGNNSAGGIYSSPYLGYDFGSAVTPYSVEYAPITGFTWTPGQIVSIEYSADKVIWKSICLIENRAAANNVVELYNLPTVP